jgi:MoaA/NifB/PqqE/SkfB family radical SAM enzyme
MNFPQTVSFTITNACNLRCRMCGQWSEEGYMRPSRESDRGAPSADKSRELGLAEWKRLIDELADHNIKRALLRGGEVFLYPDILPLLEYFRAKEIFTSIDTNGTRLAQYAADLVRIGNMHLTVSVDGPEEIHDSVRGVKGAFRQLQDGLARLAEEEKKQGTTLSKSITFTISPYSYRGLGRLPDVARSLGIGSICVVAYYFIPRAAGEKYEAELEENFGCRAYSWRGFHHEESGVDVDLLLAELHAYRAALGGITDYPYFPMSEAEYRTWFTDAVTPIGSIACANVEKLIDIQPTGEANFCVDFPDYAIGNVRESTIAELWNSPRAEAFRVYRRKQPLAVCARCGAKYMAEIRGEIK